MYAIILKRTLKLLPILAIMVSGQSLLATNIQNITLEFYHSDGAGGYSPVSRPTYGQRTLGSTVVADWIFLPETELHFKVTGNLTGGDLVLELHGRSEPFWYPGGASQNGVPETSVDESFGKVTIPLTSGVVNSGVMQHVTLQAIADHTAIFNEGDPYKIFYFGIYVDSGWQQSTVDAFINDTQVGADMVTGVYRGGFNLPVLYAHPDWPATPAEIEGSAEADVASFTQLTPLNNRPLNGALSLYRYRLRDVATNDDHIVNREWLFYRLNGGGALMATLPGQGDRGEICEFEAEEVIAIQDLPPFQWPLMLVVCRRIDDRGMVSIENYNLAQLGDDTFQYKVGFDIAGYVGTDLYAGHSLTPRPLSGGTDPLRVSDPNFKVFNPSYLYLMPYDPQLANYNGTKEYQIRYNLADQSGFTTDVDWHDVNITNTANGVWLPYFTEVDATVASYYPVSVGWRFRTEYGTSSWTANPAEIRLFNQPQAPPLAVNWDDLPARLLPGETFSVGVNASRPDATYSGKLSLWVYNPDDLSQHLQLKTTGGASCFGYGGWDIDNTYPGFVIPEAVNDWNLGENGRLAVKLKFAWVKSGEIALIDCATNSGQTNPLNDFYTLLNPNLQDDFYAARTSEASSVVVTEPGDFTVQLNEASPRIYDPSGDVNFDFYLQRSGEASPTKLEWRWSKSDQWFWEGGNWVSHADGEGVYQEVWPGTGDAFANRWRWNTASGLVEAAQRSVSTSPLPFGPLSGANLLDNFFDGQLEVAVTVEMRMSFNDGEVLIRQVPVLLQPEANDTLVLGLSTKREGQVVGQSHARFPDLPDLEWTIPTLSQIVGSIRVAFFKRDGTFPTGWETLFCEVLDEDLALSSGSNYFTSFATEMVSGQGLTYTLTAEASCGLYNLITSEGAGEYQLRVSSQTCGGNWQQAFASRLTVNPSTGFAVRFHHRDHLGSSAVSRAYSPGFDEAVAGAAPFYLKTASGNMTLYAKPAKATLFDPFGEVLGSVAGEPNPRYTDHEYDEASGLNYMKGRFSLAAYGGKFNRPDPMRDWDWENPHSINLYEYVRNNPIMANDPDGLFGDPATDSYIAVELIKNGGRAFSVIEGGAGASATGAAPVVIGGTIAWIAGWQIGSYLNEKTGASEYWADKLFTLVNGKPEEWLPHVYDDREFEVEGLVSNGGDNSDSGDKEAVRNLPFQDTDRITEVNNTLDRIETDGPFPYKKDGTVFKNKEGKLPEGNYREYTVVTPGAKDRAKRRVVVDIDTGKTYYTDDHYESFTQIDPVRR